MFGNPVQVMLGKSPFGVLNTWLPNDRILLLIYWRAKLFRFNIRHQIVSNDFARAWDKGNKSCSMSDIKLVAACHHKKFLGSVLAAPRSSDFVFLYFFLCILFWFRILIISVFIFHQSLGILDSAWWHNSNIKENEKMLEC